MTLESIGIGTMVAILGILLYPIFYLLTGSSNVDLCINRWINSDMLCYSRNHTRYKGRKAD